MCDDVDIETPTVFLERWRRARKPNACTVCREPIRPGERYHHSTGLWDGVWMSFKHCARCWLLFCLTSERTGGDADLGLDCGEVWDDPPEGVAALAFLTPGEAQRRVVEAEFKMGRWIDQLMPRPRP